jgi:hypothetical protein
LPGYAACKKIPILVSTFPDTTSMKRLLLLLISGLGVSAAVTAQPVHLGLSGGVSRNTVPTRAFDRGDHGTLNYTSALSLHYNINEHWKVGGVFGLTKWRTLADVDLVADNGTVLGNEEVTYLVAERAFTLGAELNYVIPIVPQYADYTTGELYIGISAGGVGTGGDGENVLDRINPRTPRELVYRSEFHYASGYGYFVGAQVGYTHYFSRRIGVDLNLAGRWTAVQTTDPRYGGRNERYDMFWYPATIGIKVRLGSDSDRF